MAVVIALLIVAALGAVIPARQAAEADPARAHLGVNRS